MLAKYVHHETDNDKHDNTSDWDSWVSVVTFSYNMSVNQAKNLAPNAIVLARELLLPIDVMLQKLEGLKREQQQELQQLFKKANEIDKLVASNIREAKERMVKTYNKNTREVSFKIGDLVWLYIYVFPKGICKTFCTSWAGAMRIIAKDEYKFKLRRVSDNKLLPNAIHPDRLQLYIDSTIPKTIEPMTLKDLQFDENTERNLCDMVNENKNNYNVINSDNHFTINENNRDNNNSQNESANNRKDDNNITDQVQSKENGAQNKTDTSNPLMSRDTDIEAQKPIQSISKGRKVGNIIEYYVIYADQINQTIGQYVAEKDLTDTKRKYIENNKDKIRIMRHIPKRTYELNTFEIINECAHVPMRRKKSIYNFV